MCEGPGTHLGRRTGANESTTPPAEAHPFPAIDVIILLPKPDMNALDRMHTDMPPTSEYAMYLYTQRRYCCSTLGLEAPATGHR